VYCCRVLRISWLFYGLHSATFYGLHSATGRPDKVPWKLGYERQTFTIDGTQGFHGDMNYSICSLTTTMTTTSAAAAAATTTTRTTTIMQ